MASANHSGTVDQGQYWTLIKDLNLGDWWSCNEKVVLTVRQHFLNNSNPYILFLQENLTIVNFLQRDFVFLNIILIYIYFFIS